MINTHQLSGSMSVVAISACVRTCALLLGYALYDLFRSSSRSSLQLGMLLNLLLIIRVILPAVGYALAVSFESNSDLPTPFL